MLDDIDLLVAGAGPAGCTIAERATSILGWHVLVIDRDAWKLYETFSSYPAASGPGWDCGSGANQQRSSLSKERTEFTIAG